MENLATWQIFGAIGVMLALSEIFVSGFITLPIGLGFLLTAVFSIFIHEWSILLAILAVFQVVIFLVFQKYLKLYPAKTRAYTNAEGMVGAECIVTEPISPAQPGYVKLYGDLWQAKTFGRALAVGERATITKIEGNKVFVEPIN